MKSNVRMAAGLIQFVETTDAAPWGIIDEPKNHPGAIKLFQKVCFVFVKGNIKSIVILFKK